MHTSEELTAQQQYVESMGHFWEELGFPRMAGRLVGWLLICDPPYQTTNELADALQAAKSSISTAARLLVAVNFVERFSRPGERRDYYRIRPDVWSNAMHNRMRQISDFRELADRGLALLQDAPLARRQRLNDMRRFYLFFESEMPRLLDAWERSEMSAAQPQGNQYE